MIVEQYFIDEKGIFYVQKVYGDVEYQYWVEFGHPDVKAQFDKFCERLRKEGKELKAREIRAALA